MWLSLVGRMEAITTGGFGEEDGMGYHRGHSSISSHAVTMPRDLLSFSACMLHLSLQRHLLGVQLTHVVRAAISSFHIADQGDARFIAVPYLRSMQPYYLPPVVTSPASLSCEVRSAQDWRLFVPLIVHLIPAPL